MEKRLLGTTIIIFSIFLLSLGGLSQIRETGIIHGRVMDEQEEVLPGASVTISGPFLIGGAKTYTTDQNGYYRFASLPPGPYTVSAEIEGFTKVVREVIKLNANMTLTVDFKMTQAKVEEEVLVIAKTPTVDITSSKSAMTVMTDDLLTSIPSEKTFAGLMNFVPGIALTNLYGNNYNSSYGVGGGGQNAYLIDGVDVSSSSYDGYILASPDMNIIKEASKEGLGLPAEFGNYTGTVLSAITKSGSNKFSSLNEFRYNNKQWNSQNLSNIPVERFVNSEDKETEFQAGSYFDIGLQLGGKIIHDRLWFFISGEYERTNKYPIGTPVVQKYINPRVFGKITFQLNPSNKFNAALDYDKESQENYWGQWRISPEAEADRIRPGWVMNMSWTSIPSANTLLEFKFGYNKKTGRDNVPKQGDDLPGHYDYVTGRHTVNSYYWSKNQDENFDVSTNLSYYASEFLEGSHDFKVGAQFTYHKPFSSYSYCGGMWYYDYGGEPYMLFEQDRPFEMDHRHSNFAVFAQDSWMLSKRLTLNLGLRYDRYWYKIPIAERGVVYKAGNISPRIGFALDVLGDRKNVLKVHYGHYYDKLRQSYFYYANQGEVTYSYYFWTGDEWSLWYKSEPDPYIYQVDPDVKHPFVREFTAGFERELFRDASLSISYYYRKVARFIGLVNTAARYKMVTIINPGYDGIVGTSDDMGTVDVYERLNPGEDSYLITNPRKGQAESMVDDLKNTAQGVEVIFNKRFSNRWQMNASYHYTHVVGNADSIVAWSVDPNWTLVKNAYGNIGYFYGHPHQFKLQGAVILPLDVKLGISAQYVSGENKQPYIRMQVGSSREYVLIEPPGETKYEARKNLDLRVEKIFKVGQVQMTLMADVYNVFNSDRIMYAQRRAGSTYDKLIFVTPPRRLRVGLRFIF